MLLFSAAANGAIRAQPLETVRVGSPVLRGATLRVGSDTVDDYIVNEQGRQLTATTVRTITIRPDSVEPSYEIKTLHWAAHGDTSVSVMMVRAQDLSLLFHRVKAARDSAAVNASRAHLTAWVVLPNQPIRLLDLPLSSPVFGVEGQIPWLFPLLPLGLNYRAAVPHFSQWDGRERWDTVTVLSAERVTIGPYAFDCWKVDVGALGPPGYRMTRWVDRRTRRVVQSVLRGSSGPEYWSYLRSS
jgi:hypothetical protein